MELIKYVKMKILVAQSCPTLCDFMNYSSPDSSVQILQARILEWVAIPFSRGSSQPRGQSRVYCIAGRFFTVRATRKAIRNGVNSGVSKDVKGSLNSLDWLFWLLLSDSRIISVWGERNSSMIFFYKSQSNKCIGAEELRRKGCILSRKQKEIGSETGTSWNSLESN